MSNREGIGESMRFVENNELETAEYTVFGDVPDVGENRLTLASIDNCSFHTIVDRYTGRPYLDFTIRNQGEKEEMRLEMAFAIEQLMKMDDVEYSQIF